jgi:hypothetical protein
MMHIAIRAGATLLPALVLLGCGEAAEDTPPDRQVTDSAGVTLVRQVVDTSRVLTLDEVWRVGSLDGDEATQFYTPRDGDFGPNGEVYVLDSGNNQVKVFAGADGAFVRAFGSSGSGPGEFESLPWRMDIGEGRVVVMDANRRLVAFTPEGEPVQTTALAPVLPPGSFASAVHWTGEEWLIPVAKVFDPETMEQYPLNPTVVRTFSFEEGLGGETGLAWDAGIEVESVGSAGWMISPLYEQRPHTFIDGTGRNRRVYGDDYGWEVVRSDGTLERRVTNRTERLPVRQEDLDRYEEDRKEDCRQRPVQTECTRWIDEALPAQMSMREPEFQPTVYQLDGSDRGDLLVLRADLGYDIVDGFESKRYDLFAPDGRFRGSFTKGPGFRVIAVAPDRILAIERGELDVESVVLYRISDPGQSE